MRFLLFNKKHRSLAGFIQFLIIFSCIIAIFSEPTYAYINPGIGVTFFAAIGTFIVAVIIAVFGVFLLPYKLLMRKLKKNKTSNMQANTKQDLLINNEDNTDSD